MTLLLYILIQYWNTLLLLLLFRILEPLTVLSIFVPVLLLLDVWRLQLGVEAFIAAAAIWLLNWGGRLLPSLGLSSSQWFLSPPSIYHIPPFDQCQGLAQPEPPALFVEVCVCECATEIMRALSCVPCAQCGGAHACAHTRSALLWSSMQRLPLNWRADVQQWLVSERQGPFAW